jgi:hypothetical protein
MRIVSLLHRGRGPLLAVALMLVPASPSGAYRLGGGVMGTGATPSGGIGNGQYTLLGTAGLTAVGTSGNAAWTLSHGYWSFGGLRVVGVGPPGVESLVAPPELSFGPAVPNPARGEVHFELALPHGAMVRLVLLDVSGRVVDEASGAMPAGRHTLRWEGNCLDGRAAHPGVYFARLFVDGRPLAPRRVVKLAKE